MAIAFAGSYTSDNFQHASSMSSTMVANPFGIVFTALMLSWVGLLIFAFIQDLTRLWVGFLFIAIFLVLLIWGFRLQKQATIEQWEATTSMENAVQGTLDVEGVTSNWQNCMFFHKWAAIQCHVINDTMIVLMMGVTRYIFLPRSFFAGDDAWTAAIALVKEKTSAEPPTTWRLPHGRLTGLLASGMIITMFVGLAVIYSI